MAFTKVVGPGIHTLSNIVSHNINSSGIITATKFVGPFDSAIIGGGTTITSDGINVTGIVTATQLDINGNGDISGNLVVGGNFTANGDFTTLNTTLREVELLRVDAAASVAAGIITQTGSGHGLVLADDTTFKMAMNVGSGIATFRALNAGYTGHNGAAGIFQQVDLNTAAVTFGNTISVNGATITTGNGNHRIRSAANDFAIESTTSSYKGFRFLGNVPADTFVINASGNIGIGTANPNNPLTVHGSGNHIYLKDTATNNILQIRHANGVAEFNSFDLDGNAPRDYVFNLYSIEALRITSDGFVGIGVTNPEDYDSGAKNLVVGSTGQEGITIRSSSPNTGNLVFNDGTTKIAGISFKHDSTASNRYFSFSIDNGSSFIEQLRIQDGKLIFSNDQNSYITGGSDVFRFTTGGTERVRINASGHVKLPDSAELQFGGALHTGSGDLRIYSSGSDSFFENSAGHTYFRNSSGTSGGLLFRSDGETHISNYAANEYRIKTFNQGGVELFYAAGTYSTPKIKTTATGVTVDGEVVTSQDYPTLQPTLDINFANAKSLDPRINYVRTGTASYLNEFGKIVTVGENEPRFDHDPTTLESKGLLIEESRQNMFGATADMGSNAGRWPVGGARGRRGVNVEGPDGKMTALQNIYLGTSGDLNIYYETTTGATEMSTTNSTVYTFSVFAKAAYGNSYINGIRLRAHSPNRSVSFNVVNGTVGATNEGSISSKTIVEYPNGWYRCIMTFTSGTDGNHGFQIYVENEGGDAAGLNNSSANGEAMYFWGAQLEIGSFATSFIPTQSRDGRNRGTQTTRGLDIVTIDKHDIDGIFNPEEGTMFYEASVTNLTNDNQPIVAFRDFNNTAASYHAMGHAIGGSTGSVRTWAKNTAGSNIHLTSHTGLVADTFYKHMYGYKYNDYSDAFGQGTTLKQSSGSSGNHAMVAAGVIDELRFGGYYTSPEGTYTLDSGHIRRFSYWPKKLTNTQIKTYVS